MNNNIYNLEGIYLGRKGSWYVFADEIGDRFEFDDVKPNLIEKFKLKDGSSIGRKFEIMYSNDIDDEFGYEELLIIGLRELTLNESA